MIGNNQERRLKRKNKRAGREGKRGRVGGKERGRRGMEERGEVRGWEESKNE